MHKLKSLLTLSIALVLFYLYGLGSSLDVNFFTLGQVLVRGGIALVYLVIATFTYIKLGKEEEI